MTLRTAEGIVPWPVDFANEYRARGYWQDRPLVDYIRDRAVEDPTAEALVDGDLRLSYAELMGRVDAAAGRLITAGLEPDDRILIQLPNGWQFVVLTLACFRSGVIPVMALPAHRTHELRYLIDHAEARAIAVAGVLRDFDHEGMAHELKNKCASLQIVLVSGDMRGEKSIALDPLLEDGKPTTVASPSPDAVACFLLSGGTTGLPKLIARTHNDYACNVRETLRVSGFSRATRYLVVMPAAHNFPLACPGLLGALFAGGSVIMLPSPEPARALAAIRTESITDTAVVPAVAQKWIEYVTLNPSEIPSTLRNLEVGGSRMPDEIAARVRPVLGATLQQVFGMAEGLINMTRLDDPEEAIIHSQGRPVCDADELLVLDEDGNPVPAGIAGLLYTRGPYTPRGYYVAAEHNAGSFRADGGWYGSGDIVIVRPDGNLTVAGRAKDIINRGGENISAEEIENFAYHHDGVELAAAVAMPDPAVGERVCLYVVVKAGATVALADIIRIMEQAGCARFKYPERLELASELPITKIGKIDKKQLRERIAKLLADSQSEG